MEGTKNTKMLAKDEFGSFRDQEEMNLPSFKRSRSDSVNKALGEDITYRFIKHPL